MSMTWQKLLCAERLGGKPAKSEDGRSPFLSDHDKIIFSSAFRRLARKTQVHPMATNDMIHNRMTHSLEVSCVGRSLAMRAGQKLADLGKLPEGIVPADLGDIVQSTCLAHDIGNPPFGHTGEEAIRDWFINEGAQYIADLKPQQQADFKAFEGNAQGLRILTTSEYHQFDGGMRLTYATLAAFIKYPWTAQEAKAGMRPKNNKYGIYCSDLENVEEVVEKTGLLKNNGEHWYCRHPLVYLMEAADDFCYGIIDLEDGLEMNILRWDEVFDILKPIFKEDELDKLETQLKQVSEGRRPAFVRGKVIEAYIDAGVEAFMANEEAFLAGEIEQDLISLCREEITNSVNKAKEMAMQAIFAHPRKVELEIGSYDVIARLLKNIIPAVLSWYNNPDAITAKEVSIVLELIKAKNLPREQGKYAVLMAAIDFVSGMTDNYAVYLSKQFSGMGEVRY